VIEIRRRLTNDLIIEIEAATLAEALCNVLLRGKDVSDANLRGADLRGANLRGADLNGVDLSDADLAGATLDIANLRDADLRGAKLGGVNLRNANLSGANFCRADLGGAYLRNADLHGADLRDANIRSAFLNGASLIGADLRGVSLGYADLSRANVKDANLGDLLKGVPSVPDLDAKMASAVGKLGKRLDMCHWHRCRTTHCRAGWAIRLAGKAGSQLERQIGPAMAGALIYLASTDRRVVPDFYASDDDAFADIKACATSKSST
jgi:Pentapeptide repeats (8 copies)